METLEEIADRYLPAGEALQRSFQLGLSGSARHHCPHCLLQPSPLNPRPGGAVNNLLK